MPEDAAVAQALQDAIRAGKLNPDKLLPAAKLYVHLSGHALWHLQHPDPGPETGPETGTGAEAEYGPDEHGELCPHCLAGETVPAVARVEGRIGPVLAEQVRDLLGHRRVTLTPVIDLNDNHAVDCYEVPAWMAEALHLATPASAFPHSPSTTRRVDHDHNIPYATHPDGTPVTPGQTRIGNLAGLQRRLHRVKTHKPGWRVYQPTRGVYLWRTPHGHWYRVDNTGTHRLGKTPHLTAYQLDQDAENGQQDPAKDDRRKDEPGEASDAA